MARDKRLVVSKNGEKLIAEVNASVLLILSMLDDANTNNLSKTQKNINAELDKLTKVTDQYSKTEMPNRYAVGVVAASTVILGFNTKLGLETAPVNKKLHNNIAKSLAEELSLDFASGISGVQKGIGKAISKAQRNKILSVLSNGSRKEQSLAIQEILQKQGMKWLIDRGGKKWSLDTYANMLVRTKEREAVNIGMLTRATEVGVSVFRVNYTGSKHDACAKWENEYLSINGEFGLPTVDDATSSGLFHPNCMHRLIADPEKQNSLQR